jgi:hypothetical protein
MYNSLLICSSLHILLYIYYSNTHQVVILLFLIEDNTSLLVSVPAAFGVLLQVKHTDLHHCITAATVTAQRGFHVRYCILSDITALIVIMA